MRSYPVYVRLFPRRFVLRVDLRSALARSHLAEVLGSTLSVEMGAIEPLSRMGGLRYGAGISSYIEKRSSDMNSIRSTNVLLILCASYCSCHLNNHNQIEQSIRAHEMKQKILIRERLRHLSGTVLSQSYLLTFFLT